MFLLCDYLSALPPQARIVRHLLIDLPSPHLDYSVLQYLTTLRSISPEVARAFIKRPQATTRLVELVAPTLQTLAVSHSLRNAYIDKTTTIPMPLLRDLSLPCHHFKNFMISRNLKSVPSLRRLHVACAGEETFSVLSHAFHIAPILQNVRISTTGPTGDLSEALPRLAAQPSRDLDLEQYPRIIIAAPRKNYEWSDKMVANLDFCLQESGWRASFLLNETYNTIRTDWLDGVQGGDGCWPPGPS